MVSLRYDESQAVSNVVDSADEGMSKRKGMRDAGTTESIG